MKVRIRVFAYVLLFSFSFSGICQDAAPSDQSGTFVMVGRTSDAVILAVDSKVTHLPVKGQPDVPTKSIDGSAKTRRCRAT